MKSALLGYTGFVGSNIAKQVSFTHYYNSKNIGSIRGERYDLIVSAATTSLRWKANKHPRKDWLSIKKLLRSLNTVSTKHFILISSIDVYPEKQKIDEDYSIKVNDLTEPYGRHRYKMEDFVKKHFKKTTMIRCTQLFGKGLRKNFIYDLIHINALEFTHRDTMLQWYDLANIWKDIQIAVKNNIPIVNFAVEPISARKLAAYTLGLDFSNKTEKPASMFDIQTKYAKLYGKKGKYLYTEKQTLESVKNFILAQKNEFS